MADTYTYDPAESTAKDRVRGLIGDISARDQNADERISDEKIADLLTDFAADTDPELSAAVEAARIRYRAVAGQKGNARAQGLEPDRRFERLRLVWLDLRNRLQGNESAGGAPIMSGGEAWPCDIQQVKIGILDEPRR